MNIGEYIWRGQLIASYACRNDRQISSINYCKLCLQEWDRTCARQISSWWTSWWASARYFSQKALVSCFWQCCECWETVVRCTGKTHSWKIRLKHCMIPIAGQWEHHRVDLSQPGALYWSEYICTWSEYCGDYMGAHVQDHWWAKAQGWTHTSQDLLHMFAGVGLISAFGEDTTSARCCSLTAKYWAFLSDQTLWTLGCNWPEAKTPTCASTRCSNQLQSLERWTQVAHGENNLR